MRGFRRLCAILAMTVASVAIGTNAVVADSITWHVKVTYSHIVYLAFFDGDNSNRGWPGGDQSYVISDDAEHVYALRCEYAGQKICYGAANTSDANTLFFKYWGVSVFNNHGCSDCCRVCRGDTDVNQTLDP